MKINLNKKQWESIGKTAGWLKQASDEDSDIEFSGAERAIQSTEQTVGDEESPSLKQEMIDFLRESYGNEEVFDSDAEAAIYWFANDYHGGQASELYSILSTSPFRPGPMTTLESEGEFVTMMYEDLENKFANADRPAQPINLDHEEESYTLQDHFNEMGFTDGDRAGFNERNGIN